MMVCKKIPLSVPNQQYFWLTPWIKLLLHAMKHWYEAKQTSIHSSCSLKSRGRLIATARTARLALRHTGPQRTIPWQIYHTLSSVH